MYYRAELLWNIWNHKPAMKPDYNAVQVAHGDNEAAVVKEARRELRAHKGADKAQIYVYETPQSQMFSRYYEIER